jgi:hypothetical protein
MALSFVGSHAPIEQRDRLVTTLRSWLTRIQRGATVHGNEKSGSAVSSATPKLCRGPRPDDHAARHRVAGAYPGHAEHNLHLQGIEKDEYTVRFRVYGINGVMGEDEPVKQPRSHELALRRGTGEPRGGG